MMPAWNYLASHENPALDTILTIRTCDLTGKIHNGLKSWRPGTFATLFSEIRSSRKDSVTLPLFRENRDYQCIFPSLPHTAGCHHTGKSSATSPKATIHGTYFSDIYAEHAYLTAKGDYADSSGELQQPKPAACPHPGRTWSRSWRASPTKRSGTLSVDRSGAHRPYRCREDPPGRNPCIRYALKKTGTPSKSLSG